MCHAIILLNDKGRQAGARQSYFDKDGNADSASCPSKQFLWSREDGAMIRVACLSIKKNKEGKP